MLMFKYTTALYKPIVKNSCFLIIVDTAMRFPRFVICFESFIAVCCCFIRTGGHDHFGRIQLLLVKTFITLILFTCFVCEKCLIGPLLN